MHPVCLGDFAGLRPGLLRPVEGGRTLVGQMRYMLPLLLFTALLNPLFNHQGATVLFQLPNGSSITLEAVAYGGAAAGMLLAVVVWFRCFGAVITSDKFLYLFGRISPSLSLPAVHGLSVCAPVPHPYAGRVLGSAGRRGAQSSGGASRLFRHRHLGPENAMETADSMKGRGWPAGPDRLLCLSLYPAGMGRLWPACWPPEPWSSPAASWVEPNFSFIPTLSGPLNALSLGVFAAFSLLCLFPLLTDLWEDLKWSYFLSRT